MAEQLPDAPWAKKEELPDAPWATETDPGFLAGAGRFARGAATGIEEFAASTAPYLPGMQKPGLEAERESLKNRPPPKDLPESAGKFIGEIAPSFAIPNLGIEGLAMRALPQIPRIAKVAGSAMEGGLRGGIGGAMTPEGDRAKNTDFGTAIGASVRGSGAALNAAWNSIPWQYRTLANGIASAFAVRGLEHLGLPNDWLIRAPVFSALWRASLLDLANKLSSKASRINPAAMGAAAAHAPSKDKNNGR